MVTIKLKGAYASNGSGVPGSPSSVAAAIPASPTRPQSTQQSAVGPSSFYSVGSESPSRPQSIVEAAGQALSPSKDHEDNQQARGVKRRKMLGDDEDGADGADGERRSPSRLNGSSHAGHADRVDSSEAIQEAHDIEDDVLMEQDDGADDDYAQSSSSQDDIDFVNAPLPLPDSSGDEYSAPGLSTKFTRHAAKARAGTRTSSRRRNTDEVDDIDQPIIVDAPPRRRGRPPKRRIPSQSLEPPEAEQAPVEKKRSIKLTLKSTPRPVISTTPESMKTPPAPAPKAQLQADDEGDYTIDNANDDDESQMDGDDDDEDGGTSARDSRAGSSALEQSGRSSSKQLSRSKKKTSATSGGPASNRAKAIEGTRFAIVRDQLMLPEDAAGETKIDHLGRLQDGECRWALSAGDFDSACRPRIQSFHIPLSLATGT